MYLEALKTTMAKGDFVVLDTETTDLDGEIIELAIIKADGTVCLRSFVKPTTKISPAATLVHHITDAMLEGKPTFRELYPSIFDLLSQHPVLTYNAVFDRKMLHHSAERNGLPKIYWKDIQPWTCIMNAFAEFYGDWNDYQQSYTSKPLSLAAQIAGFENPGQHGALGDALTALAVAQYLYSEKRTRLDGPDGD